MLIIINRGLKTLYLYEFEMYSFKGRLMTDQAMMA
jgi:hypothetical protein